MPCLESTSQHNSHVLTTLGIVVVEVVMKEVEEDGELQNIT